jgi:hypothetical protein
MTEAERIARQKHLARQRDGHHTPDWDGLSDLMRADLIHREEQQLRCCPQKPATDR